MGNLTQFDLETWLQDIQTAVEDFLMTDFGYSTEGNQIYSVHQETGYRDIGFLPEEMQTFYKYVEKVNLIGVYNGYYIDSVSDIQRKTDLQWYPQSITGGDYEGDIITFGSTGGGDLFAVHLKTAQVLLLPSYGITGAKFDGDFSQVKVIANSFNHFLMKLLEDLKAFTRKDNQWTYMI